MSRLFSGSIGKVVAQASAVAVVAGGISAFVITQNNGADEAEATQAENQQVLDIKLASAVEPLEASEYALPSSLNIKRNGETSQVVSDGETVKEVLADAGVTYTDKDKITPKLDAPVNDGGTITIQVVKSEQVTETEAVDFETKRENDNSLEEDKTKVATEGVKGEAEVTYKVTTVDGKESDREEVSREVTKEPTTEVIKVGTKKKETEQAASNESSSSSSSSSSSDSSSSSSNSTADQGSAPSGVWAKLAQCESGGNPATNTGNGYYGLYQFNLQTWRSVGGTGLPSDHSAAEQTKRAKILQQRAGWGQWPACTRAMGLR